MTKRYSIAEARDNLAAIVHELERVDTIEITRRGEPVAVLVSKIEFDRMQSHTAGFWDAYQAFRKKVKLDQLGIDPQEIWGGLRDKSRGREVEL